MRDMTSEALSASTSEVIRPIVMVDFDFESGHTRVHSADGDIVYDGNTFIGLGELGKISTFEESSQIQSTGIQLMLSGVDSEKLSIALGQHYQGRRVIVYIAFLDDGHQLIDDPVVLWQGRMDNMNISMGQTSVITITAQNPLADWDRPRTRRYNNDDQQAKYPGDLGFEFVEKAVGKDISWGGAATGKSSI